MDRFRFRRNPCLNIEIRGVGPGKECMSYTYIKPYSELKFSDDFMFGKVMEDPKICRKVLETLLQRDVGELAAPEWQKELKITKDGKQIRLDIFTREDSAGVLYDTEMQNLGRKKVRDLALPKRARYYQSIIDVNDLSAKSSYDELKESNVIFICTFDPFGEGRYRYSFSENCEENCMLPLESGTRKIFYNTKAKGEDIPEAIRMLFDYINTGIPKNELTGEIEDKIEKSKFDRDLGISYMRTVMRDREARYEARKEGLEEGRKEGREKGREEALLEVYREGILTEAQVCERLKITPAQLKELERLQQ